MTQNTDPMRITVTILEFALIMYLALMVGLIISLFIEEYSAPKATSEEVHVVDNYINEHCDAVWLRNKFDSTIKDYPPRRSDMGNILLDASLTVLRANTNERV